jgi:hypothetical protein
MTCMFWVSRIRLSGVALLILNMTKSTPLIHHSIFAVLWIYIIITGVRGIDFGTHWDERKLMKSVRDSVLKGELLPGWYNYPSMIYDLVVLSASPEILSDYLQNRSEFADHMEIWLVDKGLILRSRKIFLGLVSLSILWVYLLTFKWTGQWTLALLGSAILASSWEVAYHARWIAPDAILMQFGVLSILLVFLALGSLGKYRLIWLSLATITAGLACGTKYFGGIFLLPIFIGGHKILNDKETRWGEYLVLYAFLGAIFALSFLLTTPGALIDRSTFVQDIQFEIEHYRDGHRGYTVNPGREHAVLLSQYLFGVFFSKYQGISIVFSVFALIGLYSILKEHWKKYETWIFLSPPLFYLPYMTLQKVMQVRNYLLLFPFLAILCAIGIGAVWKSKLIQSNMMTRYLLIIGMTLGLVINFIWIYSSANSIVTRKTIDQSEALQNYLNAHQETNFYLSEKVRRLLHDEDRNELQNIVNSPSNATAYVCLSRELKEPIANRLGVYNPVFGPYEVNFDYYPSWEGDVRIVIMPIEAAFQQSQFGIPAE